MIDYETPHLDPHHDTKLLASVMRRLIDASDWFEVHEHSATPGIIVDGGCHVSPEEAALLIRLRVEAAP